MGRTSRLATLFVALLVLAALAAAASASSGAIVSRGDVTGSTVSCDIGTLTVTSGSFQIVTQQTQTASGAYHLIVEGNAQGVKAVGPDGATYLVPGGFWTELNVTPGATTSTEVDALNVVGKGGALNFPLHAVLHTTVDANGNVTASVDHFSATGNCSAN